MSERIYTPQAEYMTASRAAKELGVDVEVIWGLVNNRQLAGTVTSNGKGNSVTMVRRDAVADLRSRMG